jgi:glycosyltransferase involved in cell wall biosynthesis
MRVAHLSTYDITGGAARSAFRLHRELVRLGHESTMLVRFRASRDPRVVEYLPPTDLPSRWRRRSRRKAIERSAAPYAATRPTGLELFSEARTPFGGTVLEQVPSCDVMNLHWIANYVDYELFFQRAAQRRPIVWTLHDMNAMTGGCHYDLECGRFTQRCGACPQLGSGDPHDLAAQTWDRKRAVFERLDPRRFCIVTPSQWLGVVARRSPILRRFRVETIPYGLDIDDFAPRDRAAARDVLGIPQDASVILFVADVVDNRRKGFTLLAQVLTRCAASVDRLWLLSVGHNRPELSGEVRGSHLGYVNNDRFLSLAYSAADLFVIPSLQDNLPNTVMEAMACGTPVVGFDVGGIRDMVRDGVTGSLVNAGDTEGLRDSVVALLKSPPTRQKMSEHARQIAIAEYPLRRQAQRYSELYKELAA